MCTFVKISLSIFVYLQYYFVDQHYFNQDLISIDLSIVLSFCDSTSVHISSLSITHSSFQFVKIHLMLETVSSF